MSYLLQIIGFVSAARERFPFGGIDRDMENSRKATSDQIIAEMHRTVDRLAGDGADRGDIKILARALRELRHSFRVLAEHKGIRKVTVFGSARCPPDSASHSAGRWQARGGWWLPGGARGSWKPLT